MGADAPLVVFLSVAAVAHARGDALVNGDGLAVQSHQTRGAVATLEKATRPMSQAGKGLLMKSSP